MVKKDYRVEIAGRSCAAIVPTDDAVVYVTALRRAAGAELGNYIRDVYPVLSSEARSLRDKIAAAGEHEAVDIRAEIPRDGGWATNRVHHGKYVRPNGACRPAAKKAAPKRASRGNGVRSPSYPYLVVDRMTGRVHAGAETRNDAEDMRHDLPTPAADLQTLTREGVRRKFGRISWASVATMRNPQRPSRANGATFAKVTGDRARGSTVRGARHNYRTVEVLVYQSPNSMATARTYEIVTDASYNMGDGAYTTDVWKLPEPVAVQQAIYTAVRNLRGGGRNRRALVQAE